MREKAILIEARNSPVRKSSYEIELHKMTLHFELLQNFYRNSSFELLSRLCETLNFASSY